MHSNFSLAYCGQAIDFIVALRKLYRDNEIEISVTNLTEKPSYSVELIDAARDVEKGENVVEFTMDEFKAYSDKLATGK